MQEELTNIPGVVVPKLTQEDYQELIEQSKRKKRYVTILSETDSQRLRQLIYSGVLHSFIEFDIYGNTIKIGLRSSIPQDKYINQNFSNFWVSLHIDYIIVSNGSDTFKNIYYEKSFEDLDTLDEFISLLPLVLIERIGSKILELDRYIEGIVGVLNTKGTNLFQSNYIWGVVGSMAGCNLSPLKFYSFLSPEYSIFQEQFIVKMKLAEKTWWSQEAYRVVGFANPFGGKELVNAIDRMRRDTDEVNREHEELIHNLENYVNDVMDAHEKIMQYVELSAQKRLQEAEEVKKVDNVEAGIQFRKQASITFE